MSNPINYRRPQPDSLADVLERVLDKGVVIAGDIVVNVLDIELLSLKLRLFVASAQTAQEMGMDWWTHDPFFTSNVRTDDQRRLSEENEQLRNQIEELKSTLARGEVSARHDHRERQADH